MNNGNRTPQLDQLRTMLDKFVEAMMGWASQNQQGQERQQRDGHRCKDHCGHHKTSRPNIVYVDVKYQGPGHGYDHWDGVDSDAEDDGGRGRAGWRSKRTGSGNAHVTTASSASKKRRLGLFEDGVDASNTDAQFDHARREAHATTSPPSSPQPPSVHAPSSPSPAFSHTTRNATPPRTFPAHIHEEVLQSRELAGSSTQSEAGASPSGQFAGIHIDSGSSMSGSEYGGNNTGEYKVASSPSGMIGARSSSPAKRSAADMEDAGDVAHGAAQQTPQTRSASFAEAQEGEPTDDDEAMVNMTNGAMSVNTQETVADSATTSTDGTTTANTSASSLQSEEPPPYSEDARWSKGSSMSSSAPVPSIDEQCEQVYGLAESEAIDEGTRGYVVSAKWLARVQSRSSEGLSSSDFAKESREGPVGPLDNSDIVPAGAFDSGLKDLEGYKFVPLRPELSRSTDFEVLPSKAWILIVQWYGQKDNKDQTIVRYAHNTTDVPSQNIVYELEPPMLTVRKVPQPGQQTEHLSTPPTSALEGLRRKNELRARGQSSPDDAIVLVSSQTERIQKLLRRAKDAAGIPVSTKVKVWRELVSDEVTGSNPDKCDSMLSPPQSRNTSPAKTTKSTAKKLVVSPAEFKSMEIGKHLEHIDVKDETNNEKYNGSSTTRTHAMFNNQTILLEEQIGGPAGGEFQSDGKKGPKLSLAKKTSSNAPSTTASGRTSPAPGGMMTRGRARRDGRTRGTVGLSNLGNTCYMNSALQCIRSVEELAMFFLSGKYKKEINTGNPLGHNGVMAKQYAGVVEGIYADNATGAFNPGAFKKTLGNIQPIFSGYQQQDSQEFLSFLVDALHEDLNRIVKKPYIENPDSDDKTVHDPQAIIDLGETYRQNHKARNDSVATDLFSGFYKNTMECPVCDKVSITFDPFSSLTVQLPVDNTFQHDITYIPLNGPAINHAVDMDKNASIKTLKEFIASRYPGVTADRLWMIEVYNRKIYKTFLEDKMSIGEANIGSNDYIYMYELPAAPTNIPEPSPKKYYSAFNNSSDKNVPGMETEQAEHFAVPIFSRKPGRYENNWEMALHPLYIMLTREEAKDYDIILKKVLVAVSHQTSRPILTELDEDDTANGNESSANTRVEKDDSVCEDTARVSDCSVPSEDGYVDVSIDKSEQAGATGQAKEASDQVNQRANTVPARFMDPQYFISPALRTHLFELKFTKGVDNTLCAGTSGFSERDARPMFERVRLPARRPSVQSSTSEDSSISTGFSHANDEDEESDADDDETPQDVMSGLEDALHLETPTSTEPGSDGTMPENSPESTLSKAQRRRQNGKQNKFSNNRNRITYSGKGKKPTKNRYGHQQRPGSSGSLRSTQSHRSLGGKKPFQDENPYYLKLGECIVLDWIPEGWDSLFGGKAKLESEMRGHWLSSENSKGITFMPDPDLEAKQAKRHARQENGITLDECFAETGKRETLSEDNAWYCGRCKELRQAAKTLEIWTIPDVLIVHLKRFAGNRSFRDKIDVVVDYPIEGLDLTQKIGLKEDGKEYLYDLFAVDNHYGGLGGGHYTALAKSFYDGQWYSYNDSHCSRANESELHSKSAYLLFYRRRSEQPLGPQYLQDIVNEARNPTQTESAGEEAERGESGEGRLGGPTSSGSSSAYFAAGAGTNGSVRNPAGGGAPGAGNSPTRKQTTTRTDGEQEPESPLGLLNGKPIVGPERPPHLSGYGTNATPAWNFDSLNDPSLAEEGDTDKLRSDVDDGDHDSTAAEPDRDSAYGGGFTEYQSRAALSERDEDYDTRDSSGYAGAGTPEDDTNMLLAPDHDQPFYSGDHDERDNGGALHLEDAGMMGGGVDSPPAHEIYNEDEMEGILHQKRD
ncbi:hypothetical protein LTR08_006682 [Meristemomyces frigidus]|nr:hypothetical protein LTR08_006682 [Meristemomyces frigidus]